MVLVNVVVTNNMPTTSWEEELKEFEMKGEEDNLHGCLVYHEAIKGFISSTLREEKLKLLEAIKNGTPIEELLKEYEKQ